MISFRLPIVLAQLRREPATMDSRDGPVVCVASETKNRLSRRAYAPPERPQKLKNEKRPNYIYGEDTNEAIAANCSATHAPADAMSCGRVMATYANAI
jgi:hypothetical protein